MDTAARLLTRCAPAYERPWLHTPLAGFSRRLELLQGIGEAWAHREKSKTTVRVAQASFMKHKDVWRLRFPTESFESTLFVALFPRGVYCFQGAPRIDFEHTHAEHTEVTGTTLDDCLESAHELGRVVADLPFDNAERWVALGLEPPPFDAWTKTHRTVNDLAFAQSKFHAWSSESRSELFTEVAQAVHAEHCASHPSSNSVDSLVIKCSKVRWRPKLTQWGLWWTNCAPSWKQDLLLVGYLPKELRIWQWDARNRAIDKKRRLACRLDASDFFVRQPPGKLIASFPI
eukprot:GEMP01060485.1.p1 GENE.GEMP01060485.1~~GEMP01060485.1.p1  ORF type:complete len:288 (+),score=42.41 GEMP01060485.1:113-976(+)